MKQTVLITGASSGIGLELAKVFARAGYNLVLTARSEGKLNHLKNKLEQFYGITAYVVIADLAKKNAAKEIYEFTEKNKINIDILINNAGFGDFGRYNTRDFKKHFEMVNVNILALMQLTHLYLKPMLRRRHGKIINIASVASFMPGALMSTYYASKAFVLSFSEALSVELLGSGVSIRTIHPGPVATDFKNRADWKQSKLLRQLKPATAKEIANFTYQNLNSRKTILIPGFANRVAAVLAKFAPRKFVKQAVYLVQR